MITSTSRRHGDAGTAGPRTINVDLKARATGPGATSSARPALPSWDG